MTESSSVSEAAHEHSPAPVQTTTARRLLLWAIMGAVFMVAAEARVIAPLLPAIALDFRTSIAATGALITAYTLPYGIFQIVYGPLADRFSRQRVMGISLGLFALGTLVSGFAPSILTLTIMRLCTGAAAAGVIPIALAYVGDAVPYTERQAALGRIVSIAALGGVLSAALGGIIATFVSWRVLFIGYGVVALLVAAWLLRLPVTRLRQQQAQPSSFFGAYRQLFQLGGTGAIALYVLVCFEGFAAMSTFGYLGALLFERDHLSYAMIGGLLMLNGIASMLTARFVGRIVARIQEQGMLLLGGGLLTVSYLLIALQPTFVFFPLGVVISGIGFVIAHSTLQTRATEIVPTMRGTAVAVFAFALFVGGGIGTALAGLMIDWAGYAPTLFSTAALLAVFTIVSGPLLRVGTAKSAHARA